MYPVPANGLVRGRCPSETSVRFVVSDTAGTLLGAVSVPADEIEGRKIQLALDRSVTQLRVVGSRGDPLPGLDIRIGTPAVGWVHRSTTDSTGTAKLTGIGTDVIDVSIRNASGTGGVSRDVALRASASVMEFEPVGVLALRLVDGEHPLSGVPIWIQNGFGFGSAASRSRKASSSKTIALMPSLQGRRRR